MAISKEIWNKAKAYFEAGKSLTYISDTLDINKSNISRRAKKEEWIKGKTQQLKADIIELENKKATISQQNATLTQQVSTLEDFEITTLDEMIQEETKLKSLIFNATVLNIIRTNEHLTSNKKYEKINVGDGVQNFEEVGLGSADYKNIQDTLDKASITLGVNERHAKSSVEVNNANINQTQTKRVVIARRSDR